MVLRSGVVQGYRAEGGGHIEDVHFERVFGTKLHTGISIDLAMSTPDQIMPALRHGANQQTPAPLPPATMKDVYFQQVTVLWVY